MNGARSIGVWLKDNEHHTCYGAWWRTPVRSLCRAELRERGAIEGDEIEKGGCQSCR